MVLFIFATVQTSNFKKRNNVCPYDIDYQKHEQQQMHLDTLIYLFLSLSLSLCMELSTSQEATSCVATLFQQLMGVENSLSHSQELSLS
jgi:hypothetical protein